MSSWSRLFHGLVIGIASVALVPAVRANEPVQTLVTPAETRPLSAYSLQTFTTRDGLPLNYVPSILQDPRGFLWFGSAEGVTRFDGGHFHSLSRRNLPGLTSDNVGPLALAPNGSLWLGTAGGGVLRLERGRIVESVSPVALPNAEVSGLAVFSNGDLWIGSRGGLCRWRQEALRCFGAEEGLPATWIGQLVVQSMGATGGELLWAISAGGVAVGDAGGFERLPLDLRSDEVVSTLELGPEGRVWIGTSSGRVGPVSQHRFQPSIELDSGLEVTALAFDDVGGVWLGTGSSGVFRWLDGKTERLSVPEGLSNERVQDLLFDREGFLWVGTFSGLVRVEDSLFSVYGTRHGLARSTVIGVSAAKDGLYVVADDRTTYRFDGETLRPLVGPEATGLGIRGLLERRDGTLWAASAEGLLVRSAEGFDSVESPAGGESITSLFEDSRGCLWIGMSRSGVHRNCGSGSWESWGSGRGPDLNGVYTFSDRRDGGVWIGGRDGLLQIEENGDATLWTGAEGLPDPLVVALHEDPEGILWLGTVNAGLVRYRGGQFETIAEEQGLPSNTVWSILPDEHGYLWVSSNRGVTRIDREQLMAVADGRQAHLNVVPYGPSEGLVDPDCVGGSIDAGARTRDGTLAFATPLGVAVVGSPERAGETPPAPLVYVVEVRVDGTPVELGSTLEVPAGSRRIGITLGVPTMRSASRVRLKYRLVGFENSWRQIEGRDVIFTNLAPGDYWFEASATRDGVTWSPESSTLIVVAARWYERLVVKLLAGVFVLLGIVAFFRRRLREAKRRELELSMVIRERTEDLRLLNQELESRNRQLADLTTQDALTGLANRRRLEEALRTEWRRCARQRQPLSLLMVDVDAFKAYNDSEGHPAGDRSLVRVAEVLQAVSRRTADTVARYGGEEFAVLLPDTASESALHLAEAVRQGVEEASIPHPASPLGSVVTVSVGVATTVPDLEAHEAKVSALVEAADRALYRAKREGRNRVEAD